MDFDYLKKICWNNQLQIVHTVNKSEFLVIKVLLAIVYAQLNSKPLRIRKKILINK